MATDGSDEVGGTMARRALRRLTWKSGLPRPPLVGWAPGAKKYLPKGEVMLAALMRTTAWREHYLAFVAWVQTDWGAGRIWTALQMEILTLLPLEAKQWRVSGYMGFISGRDGARQRRYLASMIAFPTRGIEDDGSPRPWIPSEATFSRYGALVPHEARAAAARDLFEAIRDYALTLPEVIEQLKVLYLDSFDVFITGKPAGDTDPDLTDEERAIAETMPRRHRRVEGAGRRARNNEGRKPAGAGFKIHDVVIGFSLPLILDVGPINEHDKTAAMRSLVPELGSLLAQFPRAVRVVVADSAYWGRDLTKALYKIDCVPNIHLSTHAARPTSQRLAARRNLERVPIRDTDWEANGHYEFFCKCGDGTTSARIRLGERRVLAATELTCGTCGNTTITAGRWRLQQNPKEWRKIRPGDPEDTYQPAFGNPLTFNDPRAKAYGEGRFGHQERFHSQLQRGFNLGGDGNPAPLESIAHLEWATYMVAAMMWANAIERILERRESDDVDLQAAAGL